MLALCAVLVMIGVAGHAPPAEATDVRDGVPSVLPSFTYDRPATSTTRTTDPRTYAPSGERVDVLGSLSSTPSVAGFLATKDVPSRVSRVVEERVGRRAESLGAPGEADVFVTGADDIAGMSAKQIAKRLSLYDDAGNLRSGPFSVFEFDTPIGIASPIRRTNPGFVGRGRTAGGASEYVVPNSQLRGLRNLRRTTAR